MSNASAHKISKKFAAYPRLNPFAIGKSISAADLIDQSMLAYNGGRLREAAHLLRDLDELVFLHAGVMRAAVARALPQRAHHVVET